MTRFLTISALSCALLGACSKKKDDRPAEPAKTVASEVVATETPPKPTAAGVLVIKAAKLTLQLDDNNPDGPESITLDDKGHVLVEGATVATIGVDGKIVDKDGKEIANLDADGTLHFADEEETGFVAADGSLIVDGEKVASFDDNDMLVMAELDEKVKFEGPDEAKRVMMVVFMVAIMDTTDASTDPEEVTADAPMEE